MTRRKTAAAAGSVPVEAPPQHVEEHASDKLNNPKFLEFLAKFPDAETADASEEQINERFKKFEEYTDTANAMRGLLKKQLTEILPDLTIDDAALDSISESIQEKALSKPEEIKDIRETVRVFLENPRILRQKQEELNRFNETLDAARLKVELADKAHEMMLQSKMERGGILKRGARYAWSFFSKKANLRQYELDQEIEQFKNLTTEFESEANALLERIETVDVVELQEEITALEVSFEEKRVKLMEEFVDFGEVQDTIQEQVTTQIGELLKQNDLVKFAEAQGKLERAIELSKDPLSGVDAISEAEAGDLQKALNEAAETLVAANIAKSIETMSLGDGAFKKFEDSLKVCLDTLSEGKGIGSKKGAEAKAFILGQLDAVILGMQNLVGPKDKDATARRLLILGLRHKIASR
jgi:hypothetical protein